MYALRPGQRLTPLAAVCRNIVITGVLFSPGIASALRFEPGVGLAVEYTDNARLTQENQIDDVIAAGYVGASLTEIDGPLTYAVTGSLNKHIYTQDTYEDQRYFNMAANVNWAMIKDRFDWNLRDNFSQRPVRALGRNTPGNLQNTNAFTFSGIYHQPISARQRLTITPAYSQYYYEVLTTDNNQLSLNANWNYQAFRLTNLGLNFGIRSIDYTEENILGQTIADTTFTNVALVIVGKRLRSDFNLNIGATNVKRDDGSGAETTGFTGSLNWLIDLSSRSDLSLRADSNLTDSSSLSSSPIGGPGTGIPDDVQISTDVIRTVSGTISYMREDASIRTRIWTGYRKLKYSSGRNNRNTTTAGIQLNYPFTPLLHGGTYVNYSHAVLLSALTTSENTDDRTVVGGNLKYQFSRKLKGLFDIKYRTKESTRIGQTYNEFSVYASIVYGFGQVYRPTRAGGF